MKPAVRAIVEWGRKEEAVKTVMIRVHEENAGSRRIVEGSGEFVRINGEDEYQDWPETKGGGRKRLLAWEWKV
jgi:RimJ/RimL family protein N-acetyltransferase